MPLGEENVTRYKIVLYRSEEGYNASSERSADRKAHPLPLTQSLSVILSKPE